MRTARTSFIILLLILAAAGCGKSDTSAPPQDSGSTEGSGVNIENSAFEPAELTMQKGAIVTWENRDGISHTVTADNDDFDSEAFGKGKTFEHKFSEKGTFKYHCEIHPNMKGQITIK